MSVSRISLSAHKGHATPGNPDSAEMGKPGSIGCIRMRNCDVIALFDRVPVYTRVDIVE